MIVSDSTPLIVWARIGQLHVLKDLFGHLLISQKVYEEVVLFGNGRPGEQEIVQANWIQLRSLAVPLKEPFRGEDEAIALALEIQAEFVIIDEVRGYRKAKVHGLTILRSGGLLVMAKQAGFIKRVRPILDHMIHEGFWLHHEVYQTILERVGEG